MKIADFSYIIICEKFDYSKSNFGEKSAMQTMRFSAIASDMERKIRTGVFGNKMPTTPELAAMYRCGKCTVTNALRALENSGLLYMESRRGGLLIDRSKLRSGKIGLVGPWQFSNTVRVSSRFESLLEVIRQDGFEPVWVYHDSVLDSISDIQHLHSGFDGLIFTNSTLNEEIVLDLESKHIPFISCNRLPFNRRLNFIGFNLFQPLSELVDILVERGYKNIAFLIPGRVEGFNSMARKNWLKLKKSRNLAILPCDRLLLNWRDSRDVQLAKFLEFCRKESIEPDALILWSELPSEVFSQVSKVFNIPQQTLLLGLERLYNPQMPGCVTLKTPETNSLTALAYEALRELIYAPSQKIIKRFVEIPQDWICGEIPYRK